MEGLLPGESLVEYMDRVHPERMQRARAELVASLPSGSVGRRPRREAHPHD